jgi:hypothetical protein
MITFIGVLLILAAAGMTAVHFINNQIDKKNAAGAGTDFFRPTSNLKIDIGGAALAGLWTVAIVMFTFGIANPFDLNDAGERQVVQTIGGDLSVRFDPGIYWAGPFSKVTTWPNNFTIQISKEKNKSPDADLWILSDLRDGTFSEGDNAELEHTVKWDLPGQEAMMIDLHITYSSVDNLMSTTLLSYQKKIASFSTQRMSSEAHYSGGKSQLDEYFQDQLRNGQVLLITSTKTRILEDGSSETYIDVTPKLNRDSTLQRTESDIQVFGILSTYTSMDNVHYDALIDTKLKQKIKYAADKANSKQELIAAQQEEQTAIVKGRKLIAEVTATEEAAEATAVIQARKAKLVAVENLEQAKLDAQSTLVAKKAQAEGDRLKVIAGLSPLEQAQWDYKTAVGVAEALSKRAVPSIVMSGGSAGQSSLANSYTMENMLLLQKQLSK